MAEPKLVVGTPQVNPVHRFQTYVGGIVTHLRMMEYAGRVPDGTADRVDAEMNEHLPNGKIKTRMADLDDATREWVRFADEDLEAALQEGRGNIDRADATFTLAHRPEDF